MKPNIQYYVIMNWKILNHPLGLSGSIGISQKKEMPIPLAIPIGMAAFSALSSFWGSSQSQKAAREQARLIRQQRVQAENERRLKQNQRWADTASGQETLRILGREADKAIKRTMGGAAVGGLTDAAVAQEKELQNQKQADVLAQANADFESRKDAVDASYRQEINSLNQQQAALESAKAQATAQAASGVSNALMQGALATFSGTKLGQSWFGGGSPGGTNVSPNPQPIQTPAPAPATPVPVQSGINPQMFQHQASYLGNLSQNLKDPEFTRNLFGGIYNSWFSR